MNMAIINGLVAFGLLILGYYVGKYRGFNESCEAITKIISEMLENANEIKEAMKNGLNDNTEN